MNSQTWPEMAAIDLGSNSFHMVIARQEHQELRILESLSEKVQLGAGLDKKNNLTEEVQLRALDCLAKFAQRINDIPRENIRVVGTNTLRVARNARSFLAKVDDLLGVDVEIVAGREEARLIYLGVSHYLPDDCGDNRLVVDIGGGSTEFIIGSGFEAQETESLHMGCVSYSQRFFANGNISEAAFDKAVLSARQEVVTIQAAYRKLGWQQTVGASGTVKAIALVCEANGWSQQGITWEGLQQIRKALLKVDQAQDLRLKGLREDRRLIFPAGTAILFAIFEQLKLTEMTLAAGALREGALYDLLGRAGQEDVRERSIGAMMARYSVDGVQAERVVNTALMLFDQVKGSLALEHEHWRDTLRWAAWLHEVGQAVSHTQFHKHGAYLISNSDLPGFSRQEQEGLALLVRGHRRKIPQLEFEVEDGDQFFLLSLILRLAVCLHHARSEEPLPGVKLSIEKQTWSLNFPNQWLEEYPLTRMDLEQEVEYLSSVEIELSYH